MAYTQHKLHVTDGKASCYLVDPADRTNREPHDNPLTAANLPRVLFHSDLPYYEAIFDQSVTLTLPARSISSSYDGLSNVGALVNQPYVDHYPFGTGTTTSVPRAYLSYSNRFVDEWIEIQSILGGSGLTSKRWISIIAAVAPSPILRIRENWLAYNNGTELPSISLPLRGIAFRRVTATSGAPLMKWNGATNIWQFGRLLLDGNGTSRLMREATTGIPVTADRTMDFSATGVRIWNVHTGTYTDYGTYTGSWGGPTVRKIQ